MRVLILGSTGMLGHTLFNELAGRHEVFGVQRSSRKITLDAELQRRSVIEASALDLTRLETILKELKPAAVVNCIGVIKQFKATPRREYVEINSLFPHLLADLTEGLGMRLIHFSTDCVFDGEKGNYTEADPCTAKDDYGLSKYLGEVVDRANTLTLRTSIIGHEIGRSLSLVDWFLGQQGKVKGFRKAIYTGLPTPAVAEIIHSILVGHGELSGLYHLSSSPISKFELLEMVAKRYKKHIEIVPDDEVRIDRSLNSDRLRKKLTLRVDDWSKLVDAMHQFYMKNKALYGQE